MTLTRATASLRRPVPRAWPVTTGLRAAGLAAAAASPVSVVYCDRYSPFSSNSSSAPSSGTAVGSATVSSSYFLIGSVLLGLGPLGDLRDLEGNGLLGLMRVLWTGVDLQLAQHLPAQGVLRQHAAHGLGDRPLRVGCHEVTVGDRPQATRIARMPVSALVSELVAAQRNLGGVDDDDEVPRVHVRCEYRLVLAAQQGGGVARQPAKDDVRRIDDMPLSFDIGGLRAESAHSHEPSCIGPEVEPSSGLPARRGISAAPTAANP